MKSSNNHLGGIKPSITVTSSISCSESPLPAISSGQIHRAELKGARRQHKKAERPGNLGLGTGALAISRNDVEHDRPCASPVVYDKRVQKSIPPVEFEESPEWSQHYDPRPISPKKKEPYLADNQSRSLLRQSVTNAQNVSTDTSIAGKTFSDGTSVDTADFGSRKLGCLPRPPSGRNFLKSGNIRWKKLLRPRSKTDFRTQPVCEDEQDSAGQLQKVDLSAIKRDLPRRISQSKMEQVSQNQVSGLQKTVRTKESSTSVIDLNEVEARHVLDKCHREVLSKSWDEVFKSIGGSQADFAVDGDHANHADSQSNVRVTSVVATALPSSSISPNKYETSGSRIVPARFPPLPGPRTSSVNGMVNGSPTRQSFQFVVAKLPTQTTPTCQSETRSANNVRLRPDSGMNLEESLTLPLRESRYFEGASKFGPAPGESQSTIALETIEAEMTIGRPLSPASLRNLTQPFSINCTPPQPVTAPTDPPIGPLPELPEEFDLADAASRASSHHSSSTRMSRPIVPPRSHHRRDPSTNSTSSNLTLRAKNSPRGHHRQKSSTHSRSPKRQVRSAVCRPYSLGEPLMHHILYQCRPYRGATIQIPSISTSII